MSNELIETNEEHQGRLLRTTGKGKERAFEVGELLEEFQAFSRAPFVEILAELVQGIPTPENLKLFASEHPDRWVTAIKTMANLAGYHDKLEIEGNINLDINKMGDAQLMTRLDELSAQIKTMGIRTGLQDAEFVEVEGEGEKEPTPGSPPA